VAPRTTSRIAVHDPIIAMGAKRAAVPGHRLVHDLRAGLAVELDPEDVAHEPEPGELLMDERSLFGGIDLAGTTVGDEAHGDEDPIGELRVDMDLGTERHRRGLAEAGAIEDHGAGGDEAPRSDRAAGQVRVGTDQHAIAERERVPAGRAKNRVLHDHALGADGERRATIRGKDAAVEHARPRADRDRAADNRVRSDPRGGINARSESSVFDTHCAGLLAGALRGVSGCPASSSPSRR
jgi:hypothetical protein